MTGVAVSYTATTGDTEAITIGTVSATIDGNSQQTVTVSVNTAKLGAFSGTITIAATDQTTVEIPVSGYVLDGTKICETFASLPDHWTEYAYKSSYSTYSWNYSSGSAYNTNENSTLTTPKIVVAADETLAIYAKLNSGATYGYLQIEGSTDNGETWTAYTKKLDYAAFGNETNVFKLIVLDDIDDVDVDGKKVNKLRIKAYYAYINTFNGFTYAADPVLALYSNEACTTTQASPAAKNFGFVTESQEQKYYIKNTGTGQIDLTIAQADGFTATVDDAVLTENEVATLTITMAATEGLHDGTLTVTAKNHDTDEELGTFEVALNGAVVGSKNDVNFASLSDVPAGWDKGSWTVTANSYVQNNSSTANEMTTATFTVAEGETMLVEAQGSSSYYAPTLTYSYKAGDADWTEATSIGTVTYNNWKVYAITGIPAGEAKVKFSGTYIRIRRIYGFTAKVEPFMVFAAEGTTKNFGMVAANTTSDAYTITNSGTATLGNLSVTCDNSNFEIAITDNADEIAASGSATFTVTLKNTVKGSQTGTVTISGTGVADKTFTVKGYVADDTKIFTTFAALPDRWTNTSNYWSFSANGATATSSSSKLETPKIKITEGEKLAISAMHRYSGSSYYVTINGSSDNGATWTAYTKTLNNEQLNNTDYTVVELDDIPTTVNKLQLVGYYVYVNGLNGFTYDANDPEFGVFSDAEFASQITSGAATNAWGFVSEDKTATYYIKNTGTGTMTLTKTDAPAGFTATLGATSLGTGESTSLTISMENDATTNEGYHAGDVVLTAKDNAENTLGTFTVTSSGVVVGSKTDINFASLTEFPAGWEATSWSVSSGKATISYTSGDLKTGTYTVTAGESMIVEARRNSTSTYATIALTYSYSTDGGSTWSTAKAITPSSTSYELIAISDIPAGDAIIKFTGTYIDIQRIYGYTAVAKPAMTLSPAATTYDFGMQTAAADYEMTVTNSGTATMTGLTATLTGDDAADYEVALSIPDGSTATITENVASVPVGQTVKVTATLKASTDYKDHTATLTISATDLADKAITLTGKTRDASKWYVDFADGSIPSSFVEKGSWSVSSQAAYSGSGESSLISQPINLAAGEKIYFDAKKPSYGSPSLKVRYSVNGGISWSDYVDYASAISSSTYSTHEIDLGNSDAVTAIVEFKGYYYIYLDNIYGGTLNNTASMIQVKESTTAVESGVTKAFGSIKAEATATYTIKNIGQGTLTITSPVTTTGVATAAVSATSLGSGESATLTITMPVAAPYEYKEGAVTVETSLGDFVINYTANVLNPNALDEQFTSGAKPAGWYFGGHWKVSGEQAMQEDSSTAEDLITELLTVSGTTDALTFEAARTSSSSAPTFNVYTSQDRVTWTPVDLSSLTLTTSYQDVTISGLAAGDYYVKISGARVKVDNFLGWTKASVGRDLYVTSTSIPTAVTVPGSSITASVTLTSLVAAEAGVYARLFFGETEIASDAADAALQTSKTYTMTGNVPAEEGTYSAVVKVYYSDGTVAYTSASTDVVVAHTRTLAIEEYTLSSDAAVTADADNKFAAAFSVRVKNTGTTALTAEQVSASITDGAETVYQTVKAAESLAVDAETTLTFSFTTSALTGGEFTFVAVENLGNTQYATAQTVTVTASTPRFVLSDVSSSVVASGTAQSYGMTSVGSAKTFTITNEGSAEMTLTVNVPAGFTVTGVATGDKIAATAGENTRSITISLDPTQGKGYKSGNVEFKYNVDAATELTFTLPVAGYVVDTDAFYADFNDNARPLGWKNSGWTFTNGYALGSFTSGNTNNDAEITTPVVEVSTENGVLAIEAMGLNSTSELRVYYKAADATKWTLAKNFDDEVRDNTTDYTILFVDNIPAGRYQLMFEGCNVQMNTINGYKPVAQTLTLNDTDANDNLEEGAYATVTLNRAFNAGWNTVSLPFNVKATDIALTAKAYEFTGYADGSLSFSAVEDMEAGKPYVIYVADALTSVEFENVALTATVAGNVANGATFQATYAPIAAPNMEGKYGVTKDAKIAKGSNKASMNGFRAYFELPEGATVKALVFEDTTTGVKTVVAAEEIEGMFDLSGRRAGATQKGVFIVNGKKVVVK